MSYDQFMQLIDPRNDDAQLIRFLTDLGVIASSNVCLNCGRNMRQVLEGTNWFWLCSRTVNIIKGKKALEQVLYLITVKYLLQ